MCRTALACLLLVTLAASAACTRLTAVDWSLIKGDEASGGADSGSTPAPGDAGAGAGGSVGSDDAGAGGA